MKKTIITMCLVFGALVAFSQGKEKKDPADYLPQKGDFAVQVSANPFLQFMGNMFNGTINQGAPTFGNTYKISGKYFLSDKGAIRLGVGFNFDKQSNKTSVQDIEAVHEDPTLLNDPTTIPYVNDITYANTNRFDLSAGYEWRRGLGRVQFFYGGDVLLNYISNSVTHHWGNPITENNPWSRDLKVSNGGTFGIGLGGIVGVEYFIIPKVSIGAEFGVGFMYQTPTKSVNKTESWDAVKEEVKVLKLRNFNNSYGDINFSTRGTAAINITLYF
jgi:hypothetical protein